MNKNDKIERYLKYRIDKIIRNQNILIKEDFARTAKRGTQILSVTCNAVSHENEFLKKIFEFTTHDQDFYNKYNSMFKNNTIDISTLTYDNLKQKNLDKFIDDIWDAFGGWDPSGVDHPESVLGQKFNIGAKNRKIILEAFKKADMKINGNVFDVFKKNVFPLQTFNYKNDQKGLDKLAAWLTQEANGNHRDLYQAIYAANESDAVFSTGKGEFLCLLLTKGGESGGTTALDVRVQDVGKEFYYDLKQITGSSKDLKVTLSDKSGIIPKFTKVMERYREIVSKLYEHIDELTTLDIKQEDIDLLRTSGGNIGSGIIKKGDITEATLGLDTVTNIYNDIFASLNRRTYESISKFNTDISNNTNRNPFQSISGSIASGSQSTTASGSINSNLDQQQQKLISDIFNITITKENQLTNSKAWDEATKGGYVIKKGGIIIIDVDKYNTLPAISGSIFELNKQFTPILLPTTASLSGSNNLTNAMSDIEYFYKNELNNTEFTSLEIYDQPNQASKKANNPPKLKSYNSFRNYNNVINSLFNSQYILTKDQRDIIEKYKKMLSDNKLNNIGMPAANQVNNAATQSINGFQIVEPITPSGKEGEFIIDISFYKNGKKRHIDVLNSEELDFAGEEDITKASGKEGRISAQTAYKVVNKVKIDLTNVTSHKDTIDKKVKNSQFYNMIQPTVLEKYFDSKIKIYDLTPIKIDDALQTKLKHQNIQKNIKGKSGKQQVEFLSTTQNRSETKDIKDFKSNLEKLKKDINQDNVFSYFINLYEDIDNLETQIIDYYNKNNKIMVMVDKGKNNNTYTEAYSWSSQLNKIPDNELKQYGFVTGVTGGGITCNASKYDPQIKKENTIKYKIYQMYEKIFALTQSIQSGVRKY